MASKRVVKGQFIEVPYGMFGTQVAQIETVEDDGTVIIRKWRDNSEQWTTQTFVHDPGDDPKILSSVDKRVRNARKHKKPATTPVRPVKPRKP